MYKFIMFIYLMMLGVIAHTDWQERRIPNCLTAVIGAAGMISVAFGTDVVLSQRIAGAAIVSLPLLIVTLLVPGSFGGGDIKLAAACGLFLGWEKCVTGAVLAFFLAGSYALWMLVVRKADKDTTIAFGTFLCLGMGLVCMPG